MKHYTYTELMKLLQSQRGQLALYVTVFCYDKERCTLLVDELDTTQTVIHDLMDVYDGTENLDTVNYMRARLRIMLNRHYLEDTRAAIIRMPDDQWQEIAEGL